MRASQIVHSTLADARAVALATGAMLLLALPATALSAAPDGAAPTDAAAPAAGTRRPRQLGQFSARAAEEKDRQASRRAAGDFMAKGREANTHWHVEMFSRIDQPL